MKSHAPIVLFIAAVPKKPKKSADMHDDDDAEDAKKSFSSSPRLWLSMSTMSKSISKGPALYLNPKR
jgi:hypothetical protein